LSHQAGYVSFLAYMRVPIQCSKRAIRRLLLGASLFVSIVLGEIQALQRIAEFEVASIKPSATISDRAYLQAQPGRLLMQYFSPRGLVLLAYGIADYQVVGGPDWFASDHYDLEAKAAGNATVQQMEGPMLQTLLEDRFKLKLHRETRQLPVYELSLENGNRRLQQSKAACIPYDVDSPAPPALPSGASRPVFCGFPRLTSSGQNRTLDGASIGLERLAANLSRSLRRTVIDKTGLSGTFDIHLEWADDASNATVDPDSSNRASIFTALREQLGLKLESAKGPVEVIVIDHIERPSVR